MGAGGSRIHDRYLSADKSIDLSNLRLKGLPKQMETLPKDVTSELRALNLSFNALAKLPRSVVRLFPSLCQLNVQSNQLSSLPRELSFLNNLSQLNLSQNSFKVVPDVVCSLFQLKVLNMKGNKLRTLPSKIRNLTMLETLDVSGNRLVELPTELSCLRELTLLNLEFNTNLNFPPQRIWHQGTAATLAWLSTHDRHQQIDDVINKLSTSVSSADNPLEMVAAADAAGSFGSLDDLDENLLVQVVT